VTTIEDSKQTAEQAAAATAAVRIATTARFATASRFFATAAGFTAATAIAMTTKHAEERIRVSGAAEHQHGAQRRKRNTSDHRGDS
jgi:hypothetical protein